MAAPRRMLPLVLIGAAALGGLGWYVYGPMVGGAGDPSAAPLIRAEEGPTKKRPDDPGGLAVPYQDKLIYQALGGDAVEETVERLLPAPEEPMPQPDPPKPPEPQVTSEAAPEPKPAVGAAIPALPPADMPEAPPEAAPETAATPPEPAAPAPPEPVAVPATPAPAADGPYMVQLASFRSVDDADRAWRKAVKSNTDILSAHSARVVRADLGGDKGVYYRLRIGPFARAEAAKSLCRDLKARKLDCIVVRP